MRRAPHRWACLVGVVAGSALAWAPPARASEAPSRHDVGPWASDAVFPFVDVLYAHEFEPLTGAGPALNGLSVAAGVGHAFWLGHSGGPGIQPDARFHGIGLSAGARGAVLAATCPDCSARLTAGGLLRLSYFSVVGGDFHHLNLESVEVYLGYSPWIGTDRLGSIRETVSGSRLIVGAALPSWTLRFLETMLNPVGDRHGAYAVLGGITAPIWFPLSLFNELELSLDLPHCGGPGCAARLGLSTGFHW